MSAAIAGHDRFEEFYQQHQDDLARLAYLVTGESAVADDVAADALLSAWQHWERVCASDNPLAYVRRMVINTAISRVRTRAREQRRFQALIPRRVDQVWNPDIAVDQDVRDALLRLAPRRRACLVLRYAFDLSEQEVADTLQIAVGTVKSQTAKAAAQLRHEIPRSGAVPVGGEGGVRAVPAEPRPSAITGSGAGIRRRASAASSPTSRPPGLAVAGPAAGGAWPRRPRGQGGR